MNNKKKLFLGIAGVGLLGLVGAGAGLLNNVNAVETKAAGVSGTLTLDVSQYWANNEDGQHYAVYFYEGEKGGTPTNSGWSSYVFGEHDKGLVEIAYTLDFTPSYMIAVRYAAWYEENNAEHWKNNKWGHEGWGDTGKWNQIGDLAFVDNAHINISGWDYGEVSYAYLMSNKAEPAWGNKMDLTGVKLNGSNHCEYYSTAVSLAATEKIKVVFRGNYYGNGNVRISDLIPSGTFEFDGDANIVCNTAGTYAIYFDVLASDSGTNYKVYITDPVLAAADEWAQQFLGVSSENNTCAYSKEHWTASGTSYALLDDEVKALYVGADHIDHEEDTDSYFEAAVQRYDYVLQRFGRTAYADFIGRAPGKVTPKDVYTIGGLNNDNNHFAVVASIVGAASVLAVASYVLIRRRKEN